MAGGVNAVARGRYFGGCVPKIHTAYFFDLDSPMELIDLMVIVSCCMCQTSCTVVFYSTSNLYPALDL